VVVTAVADGVVYKSSILYFFFAKVHLTNRHWVAVVVGI